MMPLKEWIFEQAEKHGVKPITIYSWMSRGKYPDLKLHRKNRRVVFVIL